MTNNLKIRRDHDEVKRRDECIIRELQKELKAKAPRTEATCENGKNKKNQ